MILDLDSAPSEKTVKEIEKLGCVIRARVFA